MDASDDDADLVRLRTLHGRSTIAWVGDGLHRVTETHWLALSGAPHADYNLALCHGPEGGEALGACIDTITARRRPAIIALGGETKNHTDPLTQACWVPVGSAPLMTVGTAAGRTDAAVRPLAGDELGAAQELVAGTFGLPPDIAKVALTTAPDRVPGRTVWGLFCDEALVSCLTAVAIDDAIVIWSMATSASERRRGYGARLLGGALAGARESGARTCLLHASQAGERLYLAAGFHVAERWDFWSRRRWVLPSG